MLRYDEEELIIEHVSLIVGSNYVISFQEKAGDVFGPIRERIKNPKSRLRKLGTDYLIYSLLDTIIDYYYVIMDRFGDSIEDIEDEILNSPSTEMLHLLHGLKRDIILLKKNIMPLRDMISRMEKGESPLMTDSTMLYFRDIHDHTIQIIDTLESFRDILTGMLDIYLSSVSNKLNEVMKVLTIISTVFIPLTFIAGIYGMNFENMPELHYKWGYFIVIGIMIVLGATMIGVFWKKKWFRKNTML
jgi:magnesium transporter